MAYESPDARQGQPGYFTTSCPGPHGDHLSIEVRLPPDGYETQEEPVEGRLDERVCFPDLAGRYIVVAAADRGLRLTTGVWSKPEGGGPDGDVLREVSVRPQDVADDDGSAGGGV